MKNKFVPHKPTVDVAKINRKYMKHSMAMAFLGFICVCLAGMILFNFYKFDSEIYKWIAVALLLLLSAFFGEVSSILINAPRRPTTMGFPASWFKK